MNDIAIEQYIENLTFDELNVGQSARQVREVTSADIQAFAVLSGDINPLQSEIDPAPQTNVHHIAGHGMWGGALISGLLGSAFPGPGTVYIGQTLNFMQPIRAGDTLTVIATVSAKDPQTKRVTFDCKVVNQSGAIIISGAATVIAPMQKVKFQAMHMPQLRMMDHLAYPEILLEKVKGLDPVRCGVVHACDTESLRGALDAAHRGLIIPVLIAPEARLRATAEAAGLNLSGIAIENVPHSVAAAERAAELAADGKLEALMKGSLHTDELMHAVVTTRALRTKRRLSHVFRFDVPLYDKPLLVTDAALNIRPSLEEKADIIQNAIILAHALGTPNPNVAILSAVETINLKMQSTLDAAALCKMADRGQITGGTLDGPLAFDNAVSMEAVRIKGIHSPVAGNADILMVPDIESGNMLAKQLEYLGGAAGSGIVLGARVPIALTSRADGANARVASAALALLMAHYNRKVQP